MAKPCNQPLRLNPFLTYREPTTGQWIVVKSVEYAYPPAQQKPANL